MAENVQVGYGRNKGDGSDIQNLQPADEKHRYTDESDSFVDNAYSPDDLLAQMADDYKPMLKKYANEMFEKASPEYTGALNALQNSRKVDMYVYEDLGCSFLPYGHGIVRINEGVLRNNGTPFHDMWAVIMHEYSHAIDGNLSYVMALNTNHASDSLRLQSTGGRTLFQTAIDELGELDGEFFDLVKNYQYDQSELNKKVEEHKNKMPNPEPVIDSFVSVLSSKSGLSEEKARQLVGDNPFRILESYERGGAFGFSDLNLVKAVMALDDSDFDSLRDFNKEYESWTAIASMLYRRVNNIPYEKAKAMSKDLGELNDIMSASQKDEGRVGRDCPPLGVGHGREYCQEDGKRATEIFATIGPILAQNGIAAKWLQEKAPKLVEGYYEILKTAQEQFAEYGEDMNAMKSMRGSLE